MIIDSSHRFTMGEMLWSVFIVVTTMLGATALLSLAFDDGLSLSYIFGSATWIVWVAAVCLALSLAIILLSLITRVPE